MHIATGKSQCTLLVAKLGWLLILDAYNDARKSCLDLQIS